MKSKYVIINGIEDVSILEEEMDDHLTKDEYLIQTEVSLISAGTELSRVYGLKKGATYPSYPGYCSVGKVVKVGNPNSKIQVGDRVLFSGPHRSLSKFNPSKSDGSVLFKLDDKTDSIDGTFLEMCWIAMNGILPADVKLSDKVAVVGLGTLGLVCSLYYKQMGVDVVAIEPVVKRAQIARELGISTIDCPIENQVEEAMKASNNEGYDIVVDATGLSVGIEFACKIAAKYGQVLLMGSPRTDYVTNITDTFSAIHMKMLTVIGALNRRYAYSNIPGTRLNMEKSLKYIEKLMNNKTLDPKQFVSHIIQPDAQELLDAYHGLMYDKEKYTGVIIDWRE